MGDIVFSGGFPVAGVLIAAGLGIGGTGIGQTALSLMETIPARSWSTTTGTVIGNRYDIIPFQARIGSGTVFVPVIRFRFDAGARTYVSEHAWLGRRPTLPSLPEATTFLGGYQAGSAVTVRYDPDIPSRSALFIEPDFEGLAFALVGVFVAGLGMSIRFLQRSHPAKS